MFCLSLSRAHLHAVVGGGLGADPDAVHALQPVHLRKNTQGKGTVLAAAAKAVEVRKERHCLSHDGGGYTGLRQCISHEGGRNTRGKGGAFVMKAVDTQDKGGVFVMKAVDTWRRLSSMRLVETQGKGGVLPA